MSANSENEHPKISVAEFLDKLTSEMSLEVLAGDETLPERWIHSARIQKLGLALAGFSHYIHSGRIQIIGQSEVSYLNQLEKKERIEAIRNLDLGKICCVLITKKLEISPDFLRIAEEENLPVLRTPAVSSVAINTVSRFLEEILAPQTVVHGVLLGMYGIGVLLTGDSGIGKSECALDLITRGHRLVADDTVIIKKIGEKLIGDAPDLTAEFLEIRGLGIINIRDLFGVSAVGKAKEINLSIELKKWNETIEIERLGLERKKEEVFGVKISKFVLPVSSGRNISTLVETAVRIYLLRTAGFDGAQKLIEKHTAMVSGKK